MASRRQAREFALQILYQVDLTGDPVRLTLGTFWMDTEFEDDERRYAEQLVQGVQKHRSEIDGLISANSTRWKVNRMPFVDRNVIRIAAYELLHMPDVPATVVINEAIEIVKDYSNVEAGAFVNGVLDKLARQARGNAELPFSGAPASPSGEVPHDPVGG